MAKHTGNAVQQLLKGVAAQSKENKKETKHAMDNLYKEAGIRDALANLGVAIKDRVAESPITQSLVQKLLYSPRISDPDEKLTLVPSAHQLRMRRAYNRWAGKPDHTDPYHSAVLPEFLESLYPHAFLGPTPKAKDVRSFTQRREARAKAKK